MGHSDADVTEPARKEALSRDSPVCVFAPCLYLTVTVEDPDEVHLHPGGQGLWIARMLAELGGNPVLCGPIGGEAGAVLEAIVPTWGVLMEPVWTQGASPCWVTDRRGGERVIVSHGRLPLERHEADDLYDKVLELSLRYRCCVVTGTEPDELLHPVFFDHLGADLREIDALVVADLHGGQLDALVSRGAIDVSDRDLIADGIIGDLSDASAREAVTHFSDKTIDWLVVSRAERGALMRADGTIYQSQPPGLAVIDEIGAGDSMTAALVVARLQGLGPEAALRLSCAAGTANVTRHGLASAPAGLIVELADEVGVDLVGSR
jgi:1-phosphofructokinase